ncbi:HD domain-containing protein [Methanosphaera sp. ISO3-F5]|uniref:3'-5' exoribonuclease YhaM family protein n=1 Tax=Methanosphaera sp. ISO3-F5 TaxID=1452353 RepID=UPI002B261CFA|nr:HD domain-containing protein [Methanosphaera sp. ISO3-F5]WQH64555.1 HD domain-containing protein [Methanosphaera sp. ISO3-F5]
MSKKEEDYIKKFNQTRPITSQFLVKHKEIKRTKTNKPYLELILQDKTGQIVGRMFDKKSYNQYEKMEINKVYNIVGKIQEFPQYSNKYNILIDRILISKKYDEEDFIRKIENHEEHIQYLTNTIKEIKDKELKQVLNAVFNDEEIYNKFIQAPAAKKHHHNYKGGLLVHTNEVIEICKSISTIYENINRDLLITGAILHDIGKIETYDYDSELIEIKQEGIMLEHLFIGGCIIKEKMNNLNISNDTKIAIMHLILSHHGKVDLGWGSSVDPKTVEAIALHQADDMSAKITKFLEI